MKILSIGTGFICAALLCGRVSAGETDYAAGTKALPLQQAGGTARAAAMGSAVVGLDQGSASLLWNPAGLSRIRCTELGLHHNTGLGDTNQEIAIIGMPLGKTKKVCNGKECDGGSLGGIAASFGYVGHGTFEGRNAAGAETSGYQVREFSGSLGWGMKLLPYFSGGIVLKNNQAQFPNKVYSTYATDVGVLWNALRSLDVGLTYSNINLGSKVGGSQLASGMRLGAAWTVDKHLILAASGELQRDSVNRLQVGTEYLIGNTGNKKNVLALRAGYQVNYPDPQLSGLTGLTLGVGYTPTRTMAIDYAMVPTGDLGASHRVSFTFKFDCPKKRPAVAMAIVSAPEPVVLPGAPKPAPVVFKWVLLDDSHFAFDSSALRPEGMAALKENAQILKDNPKSNVRVAGYASMSGTEEYNQLLSERRAAAVAEFLVKEGIAPERITTIGYGELRPAEYEETPGEIHSDAAKANRRVVFTVPAAK